MKAYFFDDSTGLFTGRTITTVDEQLVADNKPDGCSYVVGEYRPTAQRVELSIHRLLKKQRARISGVPDVALHVEQKLREKLVVDYVPPAPSIDHEWDDSIKRWMLTLPSRKRRLELTAAREEEQRLRCEQLVPLRRCVLNPQDVAARKQLLQIDSRLTELALLLAPGAPNESANGAMPVPIPS